MAVLEEIIAEKNDLDPVAEITDYVNSWYTWMTGLKAPPNEGDPYYLDYRRSLSGYISRLNEEKSDLN